MHTTRLATFALAGVLGSFAVAACDFGVPDLNNPSLDDLENDPNAVRIGAACTGLLIGNRSNKAAPNGLVSQLGILGRESYNFDTADPRYVGELLGGTLNKGSPFGGNFWALPYANIRLANVILHALDKVATGEVSDPKKAAIRGFVHTIQALDLLEIIVTHDTNGAVIDTDQPIVEPPATQPLGKIVDRDVVYVEIVRLLEAALPELDAGTEGFPFVFSAGYHDDSAALTFDTPATFRTFNRAIRARVAAYVKDYPGVLTALKTSFLDDSATADFARGVYHAYSTKTGDAANGLINPNIYGHPSLQTDAMKNVTVIDKRFTRKVAIVKDAGSVTGTPLMSNLTFQGIYPSPASRVTVIRNEELILLKAEALFFTGDVAGAITELNIVRTGSGGLPDLTGTPTEAEFVSDLLYERRYSLMFEGHRWIDARRFNRLNDLPLDDNTYKRNARYPIPLPECNARPASEPKCALGSE
jgi:hypothetical protein